MSLTLGWPGDLNLSYVIIDPISKRVFTNELPLPIECRKLNTFENRYVKISEVLGLFSETLQEDAKWVLQELLERFNVQQLVDIPSKMSEPTTYLPLSTFLAFVMVWPCCKTFQSICKAVQQFIENSSESLCHLCGWTKRECDCNGKHSKNVNIFLGYFKSQRDATCQTDGVEIPIETSSCAGNILGQSQCSVVYGSEMISQDKEFNLHAPENNVNLKEIPGKSFTNISSHSTVMGSGVNYLQPLTSAGLSETPHPNVYNVTSQGYHSLTSKKRKRCQEDEMPKAKKPNNMIDYIHDSSHGAGNYRLRNVEFSPDAPNLILNLRAAGDKNGESSFWRLVEDSDEMLMNKLDLPGNLGKMFKRFRHTVFGDVVLRCLVQNCGQCFDTQKAIELHSRTHVTAFHNGQDEVMFDAYYRCTECPFQLPFPQWHNMLRHFEDSHNIKISSEANSCSLCGLEFADKDGLEQHMEFHSNSHYRCMYCGITLFSWHQVEMHLNTCTKRVDNPKDQKLDIGCPYCSVVFQKKNIRNVHLMSHTDEGLTCTFCADKVPRTWKALKKHYDLKHAKQVKKININSEKYLNWHMKESQGPEIFCEKCSFVTTSASLLKIHMNKKHIINDFSCPECDMTLAGYNQLRTHMARHALEAMLVCNHCDREFARRSNLRQHIHQDHLDNLEKTPESYQFDSRLTHRSHGKRNQMREDYKLSLSDASTSLNRDINYPPLYDNLSKNIPNGSSVGKRGRKRKINAKGNFGEEDKVDKIARSQKEMVERLKALLKDSSARTRTYKDCKMIKNFSIDLNDNICDVNERLVSSPSTASVSEDLPIMLPAYLLTQYPLLDHSYCKTDASIHAENSIVPPLNKPYKHARKPDKINKPIALVTSPFLPETTVADNCITFPLRTTRRQAAMALNKVSACYSPPDINSSVVAVHNPLDDLDFDDMISTMAESNLTEENELLDYGFMQDMLTSLSPSKNRRPSFSSFVAISELESIELIEKDLDYIHNDENGLNGFIESLTSGAIDSNSCSNNVGSNFSAAISTKSNTRENGKLQQASQCYM